MSMAKDMPVIKTVLLKPEDVCAPVCGESEPTKSMLRASTLAISALREALCGHILHCTDSVSQYNNSDVVCSSRKSFLNNM